METQLQAVGLSEQQARVFLYLLNYSAGRKPAQVADALGLSRTNAYKVLDQLCKFDLARKSEIGKTFRYFAEDPIALTSFSARARNRAIELEKTVKSSLGKLQKQYQKQLRHAEVGASYGRSAILAAYSKQIQNKATIYLVKSRADIPFMGFETMHKVRIEPAKHGIQRFGITQSTIETPASGTDIDMHANFTRTLVNQREYTSPVEWTVSKDELTVINFSGSGSVISVRDEIVADSFRELWHLLDRNIRANPTYPSLSKNAKRKL